MSLSLKGAGMLSARGPPTDWQEERHGREGSLAPTQVGEQQCPQGTLVCLIGHFWGAGGLEGERVCGSPKTQTGTCRITVVQG